MEPITTSAMIGGIVAYFGQKLSKDKSISNFLSEFTEATVNWIKPLFLKEDGTAKEAIQKLQEKPDSEARQGAVESILKMELEDHPEEAKVRIEDLFGQIAKTEEGKGIINIIGSKNVNTGNVNTGGGDFRIGDN